MTQTQEIIVPSLSEVLFDFWKQSCSDFSPSIEFQIWKEPFKCPRILQKSGTYGFPIIIICHPHFPTTTRLMHEGLRMRMSGRFGRHFTFCGTGSSLENVPSHRLTVFAVRPYCVLLCPHRPADAEIFRISHSCQSLCRQVQSPPSAVWGLLENWTRVVFIW